MLVLTRRKGKSIVLTLGDDSVTLLIEEVIPQKMVTIKDGQTNVYLAPMDCYDFKVGGKNVEVRANNITDYQVRLSFKAPADVTIMREEIMCNYS